MSNMVAGELAGFKHVHVPPTREGAPTLLLLHGTGGDERDLIDVGEMVAPGWGMLSPRGRVMEGGRYNRFFRRLAEGVFDEDDIRVRVDELAEFIDAAATEYGFDKMRLVAVGFSNGANIAVAAMLLKPNLIKAGILLSPMVPLHPAAAPELKSTHVFIGAGQLDGMSTPAETERLALLLQGFGAAVNIYFHGSGHTITRDELDSAAEWLSKIDP